MRGIGVSGARGRRSREEADALAAAFEASGLTWRKFCQQHGIPVSTLLRYVSRWRQNADAGSGDSVRQWVAVELAETPTAAGSGLSVVLRGGRRIEIARGFDAATLAALLRVLEQA